MKGQLKQLITQSSERLHDDSRMHSLKEVTQKPVDNRYLRVSMRWPAPRQRQWQCKLDPVIHGTQKRIRILQPTQKVKWYGLVVSALKPFRQKCSQQPNRRPKIKTFGQTLLTYSASNQLFNLINYCREI